MLTFYSFVKCSSNSIIMNEIIKSYKQYYFNRWKLHTCKIYKNISSSHSNIKNKSNILPIPNILPPTYEQSTYEQSTKKYIIKKKYCNNITLGLTIGLTLNIILLLIFLIYFNIDNHNWNEPNESNMNGGDKISESLESAFGCVQKYFNGANMRTFERYRKAKGACTKLIYYMRYGFIMEWFINVILYLSALIIIMIIIYTINNIIVNYYSYKNILKNIVKLIRFVKHLFDKLNKYGLELFNTIIIFQN